MARFAITIYAYSLRCQCGANLDGDAGYYRCHARCGARSIKSESLEAAAMAALCEQLLTPDTVSALNAKIDCELKSTSSDSSRFLEQLKREQRDIEKQIAELIELLMQA